MGWGLKTIGLALALAGMCVSSVANAGTKDFAIQGYALPADKPVTIVVMRPDVSVGQLNAGGSVEPNADWTAAARKHLQDALRVQAQQRKIEIRAVDETNADLQQFVTDYEPLHRAVASSVLEFAYGAQLPTKAGRGGRPPVFDWTLGTGTQRLAELSGGNYALFLYARDNFATAGRKTMQAIGALGCIVGACMIVSGGQHVAYASLVELSTGNIVWFNILRGSAGDIREWGGAVSMVETLTASMPTRPGERAATTVGQ